RGRAAGDVLGVEPQAQGEREEAVPVVQRIEVDGGKLAGRFRAHGLSFVRCFTRNLARSPSGHSTSASPTSGNRSSTVAVFPLGSSRHHPAKATAGESRLGLVQRLERARQGGLLARLRR